MCKDLHNLIPERLSCYFTLNSNIHSYLTSQSNNLHVIDCNYKLEQMAFDFMVLRYGILNSNCTFIKLI